VKIPRDVPMYPMRTVVKLTGVDAHRIRYWETKYGMPAPSRDQQGHRLYTQEQVELIKRIGTLADDRGLSLVAIWDLIADLPHIASSQTLSQETSSQ
jgi:MerR family transcriptional regulator, light-induced transcriptional regulator